VGPVCTPCGARNVPSQKPARRFTNGILDASNKKPLLGAFFCLLLIEARLMKSISEMQEELERELRKEESESNARYEKASRIT